MVSASKIVMFMSGSPTRSAWVIPPSKARQMKGYEGHEGWGLQIDRETCKKQKAGQFARLFRTEKTVQA